MIGLISLELGRECPLLYPVDVRENTGCDAKTVRWIHNQLNDYPERCSFGFMSSWKEFVVLTPRELLCIFLEQDRENRV